MRFKLNLDSRKLEDFLIESDQVKGYGDLSYLDTLEILRGNQVSERVV